MAEWYESDAFFYTLWAVFVIIPIFLQPLVIFFGSLTTYYRRLSKVCYVLLWFYVVALILMVSFTEDLLDDWGLAFKILIPVTYLVVLWEHFYSSESEYLKNLDDASGIEEFLKTLRESLGHIMFHGKCYHWETRTRTVYETDSKGNSRTRYETYQEMVATHFDAETYEHARQVDVSPATIKDTTGASKSVTRVKLFKNYEFGDEQTAQDFHAKSEAFQNRNRDIKIAQDIALFFRKYSPYQGLQRFDLIAIDLI